MPIGQTQKHVAVVDGRVQAPLWLRVTANERSETAHVVRFEEIGFSPNGDRVTEKNKVMRSTATEVLEQRPNRTLTVLRAPLEKGASWKEAVGSSVSTSEVQALGVMARTPAGTFSDCVVVKQVVESPHLDLDVQLTYCPGHGLVRTSSAGAMNAEVSLQAEGIPLPDAGRGTDAARSTGPSMDSAPWDQQDALDQIVSHWEHVLSILQKHADDAKTAARKLRQYSASNAARIERIRQDWKRIWPESQQNPELMLEVGQRVVPLMEKLNQMYTDYTDLMTNEDVEAAMKTVSL